MEAICVVILLLLTALYSIDYYTFWYYLFKKYPLTLSWLKGGSFIEKGQFIGFNTQRDLSLMFQNSDKFQERFKDADFINEYSLLLIDKRYKFRRSLLSVFFVLFFIVIVFFFCFCLWSYKLFK